MPHCFVNSIRGKDDNNSFVQPPKDVLKQDLFYEEINEEDSSDDWSRINSLPFVTRWCLDKIPARQPECESSHLNYDSPPLSDIPDEDDRCSDEEPVMSEEPIVYQPLCHSMMELSWLLSSLGQQYEENFGGSNSSSSSGTGRGGSGNGSGCYGNGRGGQTYESTRGPGTIASGARSVCSVARPSLTISTSHAKLSQPATSI